MPQQRAVAVLFPFSASWEIILSNEPEKHTLFSPTLPGTLLLYPANALCPSPSIRRNQKGYSLELRKIKTAYDILRPEAQIAGKTEKAHCRRLQRPGAGVKRTVSRGLPIPISIKTGVHMRPIILLDYHLMQ